MLPLSGSDGPKDAAPSGVVPPNGDRNRDHGVQLNVAAQGSLAQRLASFKPQDPAASGVGPSQVVRKFTRASVVAQAGPVNPPPADPNLNVHRRITQRVQAFSKQTADENQHRLPNLVTQRVAQLFSDKSAAPLQEHKEAAMGPVPPAASKLVTQRVAMFAQLATGQTNRPPVAVAKEKPPEPRPQVAPSQAGASRTLADRLAAFPKRPQVAAAPLDSSEVNT